MLPFMKVIFAWLRLPETSNEAQTDFLGYRANVCQDRLTCISPPVSSSAMHCVSGLSNCTSDQQYCWLLNNNNIIVLVAAIPQ